MKIVIMPVVILMFHISVFAQKSKGFYLLPTVEIGMGGHYGNEILDFHFKKAFNQSARADFGYMFNRNFGFFSGVGLGLSSANYDGDSQGIHWYMNQHLVQIENPFYIRYTTNSTRRINFFGNLGTKISYLVNTETTQINSDGSAGIFNNQNDIYNAVAICVLINAGVTFKIRDKRWIDLGVFYNSYLSKYYKSDIGSVYDNANTKSWQTGIKLAYGFNVFRTKR